MCQFSFPTVDNQIQGARGSTDSETHFIDPNSPSQVLLGFFIVYLLCAMNIYTLKVSFRGALSIEIAQAYKAFVTYKQLTKR